MNIEGSTVSKDFEGVTTITAPSKVTDKLTQGELDTLDYTVEVFSFLLPRKCTASVNHFRKLIAENYDLKTPQIGECIRVLDLVSKHSIGGL